MKVRLLSIILAVLIILSLLPTTVFAIDPVYYVNSVSGSDSNTGLTAETAFATFDKAATEIGSSDGTIVIIGTLTLSASNGVTHTGMHTITGYDSNAVLAIGNSQGVCLKGPATIENIGFNRGTNAYFVTGGYDFVFGEGINVTSSTNWVVDGGKSTTVSKINTTYKSGKYTIYNLGNIATTTAGLEIAGDAKLTVDGGTFTSILIGSSGWSSSHTGVTFKKNVLLTINGGDVTTIKAAVSNYASPIDGSLQVIFNNDESATLDATLDSATITGGRYYVYSGAGGTVSHHIDTSTGDSVTGQFNIELQEGYHASIVNSNGTTTCTQSGTYTFPTGTTAITYSLAEQRRYVDAVNGSDSNTGLTAATAYATFNKAATELGNSDGKIVIIGTQTLIGSSTVTHTGMHTIIGYDSNAVFAIGNSQGVCLKGPATIENIKFNLGTNAYFVTGGYDFVFGEGINVTSSASYVVDGGNYATVSKINTTVKSGKYTAYTFGNVATTATGLKIAGDAKLKVDGGTFTSILIGSSGWSSSHTGVTFEKNVLLTINSGNVTTIKAAANNYASPINGSLQVIFNNNESATLDATLASATVTGGRYYVYSGTGGTVSHHIDTSTGNSVAGSFDFSIPEGYIALIENNGTQTIASVSGTYTLSEGSNYITYTLPSECPNLIKVEGASGNSYYAPNDEVTITSGGIITFPGNYSKEGKLFKGWYDTGNNPIANGATVAAGTTITAQFLDFVTTGDSSNFEIEGTQIRITGVQGLRFVNKMAKSTLRDVLSAIDPDFIPTQSTDTDIGYGMVVFPTAYVPEEGLFKDTSKTVELSGGGTHTNYAKVVPAVKEYTSLISSPTDDFIYFTVVLTGITDYTNEYTVKPYITYIDASGNEHTVYGEAYSTSVYSVADYIYKQGAINEPEASRETLLNYLYNNILSVTCDTSNPLSNTYKLLTTGDKKLTVGYIGGSITYGSSAAKLVNADGTVSETGGDILLSYVNRTTKWFEDSFPDATVEFVNAGVSDTATNFGVYRLGDTLMNENGHDMPDLVFVEFSVNDWILNGCITQSQADIERQMESLILGIYAKNSKADIVMLFSARSTSAVVRAAHINVAEHYGIPYIDLGIPMQTLMTARGASNEASGTYYYTVDNLHPSMTGYQIYFNEIEKLLQKHLITGCPYGSILYDYGTNLPEQRSTSLLLNPTLIPATTFSRSGSFTVSGAVSSSIFGTSKTTTSSYTITSSSLTATSNDAATSFTFTGTNLGFIFKMLTSTDINMDYRIDGGEWKNFTINDSFLGFQRYVHGQLYILEQALTYGEHTVEIKFNNSNNAVNVCIAAAAVS